MPEIAKEIGISERSAHNRISVARNIVPEVKDAIRDTEIANSTGSGNLKISDVLRLIVWSF